MNKLTPATILSFDFSSWKPRASANERVKHQQDVLALVTSYLVDKGWQVEQTGSKLIANKQTLRYSYWIHFSYWESATRIYKDYSKTRIKRISET